MMNIMKKKFKIALGFLILAGTIGAFVHYVSTHHQLIDSLRQTNPLIIALLLCLYLVWFGALVYILRVSLWLFDKTMPLQENILLNAYSSLVNFFGPGQSGPAFRALYLKKRHAMRIKDYMFGTLLYYGFYATFSALFMFVGSRPWWQTVLLVGAVSGGGGLAIRLYAKRSVVSAKPGMNLKNVGLLCAFTGLQLVTQLAIFGIELHGVQPGVTLAQVLTYTGVANLAIFVSLTPGAIGIREAFLVFSQNLHHLGNSIIVAANVIDRAVYLLFLGVLFITTLTLHAKEKLHIAKD
jgi:uncharacterized membrane protein YbhN (UPF0104 family)